MHSTAVVDSAASIGADVEIGAYSIVEANVEIGDGTWIGNHVNLRKGSSIGQRCKIFHSAVIGEVPQDLKFGGEETTAVLGDDVIIREFVTVNRGTKALGRTQIGDKSYLMAYVHIAHDCLIGENVIMANSINLGGHVQIGDWAILGGDVQVHQFTKIGKHVMVGGGFRVVQDVPPFILAAGEPLKFSGINSIGLRRKGFSGETRKEIKEAYRILFRKDKHQSEALSEMAAAFPSSAEVQEISSFVKNSERGLI
ncbi:MAG: acyl-ACP--UDP-N-acetylglucosamine O-acyltransferase [Candidatus Neomarinimicrobiota bacterium]|nr:acyl-ACP--UDP-N-acetylglucosamine O-acyltransferase [Candidatus Neomarinimicrobiota bacterium]